MLLASMNSLSVPLLINHGLTNCREVLVVGVSMPLIATILGATLAQPFWDYQARNAAILRTGKPSTDFCVYLGENAPVKILTYRLPDIPGGYDFDAFTTDALINCIGRKEWKNNASLRSRLQHDDIASKWRNKLGCLT